MNISELIANTKVVIADPLFYPRLFSLFVRQNKNRSAPKDTISAIKQVIDEEYVSLSNKIDQSKIQESCAVRNVLRSRKLASLMIDDKGDLCVALLPEIIRYFQTHLYSLGPNRQHDAKRQEQILRVLTLLQDNKEVGRLLKSISKPTSNKNAEQIIRDTLELASHTTVTDAHTRRAALAAWLCYLRQSVGSCFATAPAIIVHDEQPEVFLKDLNDLLSTGRLKRTFGGVEYTVPLSTSWGSGDLKKSFYLQRDLQEPSFEIWLSPGFLNALVAAEILDKNLTEKQKSEQVKDLLLEAFKEWNVPGDVFIVTVELLLRSLLLRHFHITEEDVKEYLNRPQGMIHTSLLMQVPQVAKGSGGKGAACAQFFLHLDMAKTAFKALADNALLKAWEFSLASFCDTKADFSRWNLYSSLGLGPQEPGGIGHTLFEIIKLKVDSCNAKVAEHQSEYEQLYIQLKYLEGRVKQATEKEASWIKAEYQSRLQEFYLFEEMRNKQNQKAKAFASLFDLLIDAYCDLFPLYFQEIYDADMHDVPSGGQYDDSPAGFRLLYKHGRANTSQWTNIYTPNDFVQALNSFFIATENEIASYPQLSGLESDLSEIVTKVVGHIKTKEFLESAFYRMAVFHKSPVIKDPLENWEKVEKKPWAYTSGGTMDTLISCYFKREQKPSEVSRWVENEIELLVFMLDTLKQSAHKTTEQFVKSPNKSLLMHSPTHAFLFKPGCSSFKEGWNTDAFTYVWARDNWVIPRQKFVESSFLDEVMMQAIFEELLSRLPKDYHHNFKRVFHYMPETMNTVDFRIHIVQTLAREPSLRGVDSRYLPPEEIDSILYVLLPFFPVNQLKERVNAILLLLPGLTSKTRNDCLLIFEEHFEGKLGSSIVSAKNLQNICKELLLLTLNTSLTAFDYHSSISHAVQKLGFAMPAPITFADTNWVKEYFGFVVSPGSGKLELWRLDCTGVEGAPMRSWQQWLNGSRQDLRWGIYTKPYEYTF